MGAGDLAPADSDRAIGNFSRANAKWSSLMAGNHPTDPSDPTAKVLDTVDQTTPLPYQDYVRSNLCARDLWDPLGKRAEFLIPVLFALASLVLAGVGLGKFYS